MFCTYLFFKPPAYRTHWARRRYYDRQVASRLSNWIISHLIGCAWVSSTHSQLLLYQSIFLYMPLVILQCNMGPWLHFIKQVISQNNYVLDTISCIMELGVLLRDSLVIIGVVVGHTTKLFWKIQKSSILIFSLL